MYSPGSCLLIVLFACKLSLLFKSAANCLYPQQSPGMTSVLVAYLRGFHPVLQSRPMISVNSFHVIHLYIHFISLGLQINFVKFCILLVNFLNYICALWIHHFHSSEQIILRRQTHSLFKFVCLCMCILVKQSSCCLHVGF